MSDIKLTSDAVLIEGRTGINQPKPSASLEVAGSGVHVSGRDSGFSFADRAGGPFVDVPKAGERWVWYANSGRASLWSGADLVSVTYDGRLDARTITVETIQPGAIVGRTRLAKEDTRATLVWGAVVVVRGTWNAATKQMQTSPGDGPLWNHVALSHETGDKLVVNGKGGYAGGVVIRGGVECPDGLAVHGVDVADELDTLRAQVTGLLAELAKLRDQVSALSK